MPTVTKSLGEGTQSVLLAVAIIERLANAPGPVGISELARQIGTSKSRILRHLQTLQSCEFLARTGAAGGYEVGQRLLELSRAINRRYDIVSVARPVMSQLRERWGHTVIISRLDDTGVHVLSSTSGGSPIVFDILPGTILPFERSAQGKIALAFTASSDAEGALGEAYRTLTRAAPGELEAIRAQGWAEAQMRQGLKGVAAPVLDENGHLLATLALLDSVADMGDPVGMEKVRDLMEAGHELAKILGYRRG